MLVVEVGVPDLHRLPPGSTVLPFTVTPTYVELDLMAQLAGMRLRERWSTWTREPFAGDSTSHVSVWEKPHENHRARSRHAGGVLSLIYHTRP